MFKKIKEASLKKKMLYGGAAVVFISIPVHMLSPDVVSVEETYVQTAIPAVEAQEPVYGDWYGAEDDLTQGTWFVGNKKDAPPYTSNFVATDGTFDIICTSGEGNVKVESKGRDGKVKIDQYMVSEKNEKGTNVIHDYNLEQGDIITTDCDLAVINKTIVSPAVEAVPAQPEKKEVERVDFYKNGDEICFINDLQTDCNDLEHYNDIKKQK